MSNNTAAHHLEIEPRKRFFIPNDPKYDQQFSLHNDLSKGCFVENAWAYNKGNSNIIVGVIDDGIFHYHIDFGNQNANFPQPGQKISNAKNYRSSLGEKLSESTHGTNMAGIIGAMTNNAKTVAGIGGGDGSTNKGVTLNAFKVFEQGGDAWMTHYYTATFEAAAGINIGGFANHVLNFSNGGAYAGPDLRRAIAFSYHNGVINVTAKGNKNTDCSKCNHPSDFNTNWVIAVGALADNNARLPDSNFGDNLDLLAPGNSFYIRTTGWGNDPSDNEQVEWSSQTSAATAHVSGVVCLLLSEREKNKPYLRPYLAPEDVKSILNISAVDIFDLPAAVGWDKYTGNGWLNAEKALEYLNQPWELDHWNEIVNPEGYMRNTIPIPQQPAEKLTLNRSGYDIFIAEKATVSVRVQYPRIGGYNEVAEKNGHIVGVWGRGFEKGINERTTPDLSLGWPPPEYDPNIEIVNPNLPLPLYHGVGYTRVVNPDPNPNPLGCTLETELYHFKKWVNNTLVDYGWYPVDPNRPDRPHQLVLAYSVLGKPNIPTHIKRENNPSPNRSFLYPLHPNPFNSTAKIRFTLRKNSSTTLDVYNTLGMKVREIITSNALDAGNYSLELDGKDLPSGLYIIRLQTDDVLSFEKALFIR